MGSKVFVVVGGQFGSEGKGAVAGRIARDLERSGRRVIGVRVGGPNAGHTVYGRCPTGCADHPQPGGDPGVSGHPWRLRQVPVAAVTAPGARLVIAQGSEIDVAVLVDEVRALDGAGYGVSERLTVDLQATVIEDGHKRMEGDSQLQTRLGSTAKGIGAARSGRIWRQAKLWYQVADDVRTNLVDIDSSETAEDLWDEARYGMGGAESADLVIEGTQGYGLGLHAGYYPYCTSGDCRSIDFLAQAGVSPWMYAPGDVRTVVCLRPYPIRVAGNSGPLYGETSWDTLGLPQELTTVTQKVRRVGQWDANLAKRAMWANGSPSPWVSAAMTMMDQVLPGLAGQDDTFDAGILPELDPRERMALEHYLADLAGSGLAYVGTGPDTAVVNGELYA